ncbi:MAG: precorrin-2 C(20)-methyltransferase [Firmicutes bacterium HGW-Firmicutes-2]|nr:MAG: precorrin-2 C(20)-methyltransferase [Firmicutes bacterium HGW-Firmicutes-2]
MLYIKRCLEEKMSKFIGIGVGPGDPELLTLKAVKALHQLDILIVPYGRLKGESEALKIVEGYLKKDINILPKHFPMVQDEAELSPAIESIAQEIRAFIEQGHHVGFITIGDPMLYSTYIYLLKYLLHQVPVMTIPGIASYSAIASGLNRPLAEGNTPLLVYPCNGEIEVIEKVVLEQDSIVLMKVYKQFDSIIKMLKKHDLMPYSLIASNYGKENQVIYNHENLFTHEKISYFTTIIINKGWRL